MDNLSARLEPEVTTAIRRLHEHPRARQVLDGTASGETLAQFYVTARETVRLAPTFLRNSYETLRRSQGHPLLIELLGQKVEEERGHDEWLGEDLAAIGYSNTTTLNAAPAAALYNSFHEQVIAICGEAFLGTAWVLESLSVRCAGVAAANLQAKAHVQGIAPGSTAGLKFFTSHCAADVGHIAELGQMLDRLVTERSAQDYVLLCARFTATLYADFFCVP